ncbi:phosphatidylserine decarboxylase-like protein [Leucogyrophana mollusca]|uniref:Phosphatidylserine decarboxylase-like protein n=1 Tax=Leucogyrophana mollusca TaxID=85980 RepID=A0ACB8B190_9AGAM|nr:phosphatidylserine decarboxylase-like protein [Leucogyrophana mollusca]
MATRIRHRAEGWSPVDQPIPGSRAARKIPTPEQCAIKPLAPVIQEFQELIESDPEIYTSFTQMFDQVPRSPPYNNDPTGNPQVRDYKMMLSLFNQIITEAPEYEHGEHTGFPIAAILNWSMATSAGLAAFVNPRINAQLHKMFDVWASFLTSPASRYVLATEDRGWFGPAAEQDMPNFAEMFVCDPNDKYHGFTSWDDFFTRRFRDGVRPVACPDDHSIVTCACESQVLRTAYNVKARDHFWLKGQPYSLSDMLNHDSLTSQFAGGTVFQAWLSARSYHRWHSPVNGTVVKATLVPGTYYAQSPAMGFASPDGPDPIAPEGSQAFLTSVATRALVFIQADNPRIGLMCFVAVGMGDVSTCETTVRPGDVVRKGDEIGMFHFGGSTHCLLFRPQTNIEFVGCAEGADIKLNAAIAIVRP